MKNRDFDFLSPWPFHAYLLSCMKGPSSPFFSLLELAAVVVSVIGEFCLTDGRLIHIYPIHAWGSIAKRGRQERAMLSARGDWTCEWQEMMWSFLFYPSLVTSDKIRVVMA